MKRTPQRLWGYGPLENDEAYEYAETVLGPLQQRVQQLGSQLKPDLRGRLHARAAIELVVAAHKVGYDVATSTWEAAREILEETLTDEAFMGLYLQRGRQRERLRSRLRYVDGRLKESDRAEVARRKLRSKRPKQGVRDASAPTGLGRYLPDISGVVPQSIRATNPLVPRTNADEVGGVFALDELPGWRQDVQ